MTNELARNIMLISAIVAAVVTGRSVRDWIRDPSYPHLFVACLGVIATAAFVSWAAMIP